MHGRIFYHAINLDKGSNMSNNIDAQTPVRLKCGVEERYHELDGLAGTWTARDERGFLARIRPLAEIDEELWR